MLAFLIVHHGMAQSHIWPRHNSFTIDTKPLSVDFGDGSSGSGMAFPPAPHPLSPEFMRERATPKQTSWQDFEREELSTGGILGKHRQIPNPSSENDGADDKQKIRLDTEFQSREQERLADSIGTSAVQVPPRMTPGRKMEVRDRKVETRGARDQTGRRYGWYGWL